MKKSNRSLFVILIAIFLISICTITVYIVFFSRGQNRPQDHGGTSAGTNDIGSGLIPPLDNQEPQGSDGISKEEVEVLDGISIKAAAKICNSGAFAEVMFPDTDQIADKIHITISYTYYIYVGGNYLTQKGIKTVEARDIKQLAVEVNPLIDDAENPLSVYFHSMQSARYIFSVKINKDNTLMSFSPDFELVNEK